MANSKSRIPQLLTGLYSIVTVKNIDTGLLVNLKMIMIACIDVNVIAIIFFIIDHHLNFTYFYSTA